MLSEANCLVLCFSCSLVFLLLLSSTVCRPTSDSGEFYVLGEFWNVEVTFISLRVLVSKNVAICLLLLHVVDDKYPYAWGYRPRLVPEASSGLQSSQQRALQADYVSSSRDASSPQDQAPADVEPVHQPEAPEASPRSGAHVNSPVASGSRFPAPSWSSHSGPRMAGAPPQSAAMEPAAAAPYFFPPGYASVFGAGAPIQSSSQDEPQPRGVRGFPQPPPPPSYIIQSRNGFIRLSKTNSRAVYSPDYSKDLVDGDPFAFLGASDPRGGQLV